MSFICYAFDACFSTKARQQLAHRKILSFVTITLSIAAIITGAVLLVYGLINKRSDNLATYNAAVEKWNSEILSDWNKTVFSVDTISRGLAQSGGFAVGQSFTLTPTITTDELNDYEVGSEEFKKYTGIKFISNGPVVNFKLVDKEDYPFADDGFFFRIIQNSLIQSYNTSFDLISESSQNVNCTAEELTSYGNVTDTAGCAKKKCTDVLNGVFLAAPSTSVAKCLTGFRTLQSVCVKLTEGIETQKGQFLATDLNAACRVSQTSAFIFSSNSDTPQALNASIEVRNSEDPFLVADRITGGSLTFGFSQEFLFRGGLVLLVLGFLMFTSFCCFIQCKVREARRNTLPKDSPPMLPTSSYEMGMSSTAVGGGTPQFAHASSSQTVISQAPSLKSVHSGVSAPSGGSARSVGGSTRSIDAKAGSSRSIDSKGGSSTRLVLSKQGSTAVKVEVEPLEEGDEDREYSK